ncbi:Mediator of RNA polymerase II transcription subunit 7b [Hirschfeldia incana]|nr:Mediator of RNA polymerase II transcription subunit 7b [Hirschfeldia incana]KAJ0234881.1 Mediator of RNA polymerase II transcription subunit 7b [Hirschfeldia incana]
MSSRSSQRLTRRTAFWNSVIVVLPRSTPSSHHLRSSKQAPSIFDRPCSPPPPKRRMATATYPPPPPYYRLYKDYSENPNSAPEPPPPIEGTYVCFGGNYTTEDVLPSLEEQGVPQLYPKDSNVDYKKELRSLNRELQLHILELADVLVERPSQYAKRIGDISSIFKNLHHLLNSLRPHQARATLIHIMELQIQQRKQAVEDIKRRREEAQRLLKDAFVTLDGQ